MTRNYFLQQRAVRLPLSFSGRNAALRAPVHAIWRCRLRYSSTLAPTNIAHILSDSVSSLSPDSSLSVSGTLTVNAFVRTVRKQKRVAFVALGDGSTLQTVQAVLTPEQADGSVELPIQT